jgi:hypothetical protein
LKGVLPVKKKTLFIFLIFFLFLISNSLALDSLNISGVLIPLIDGATHVDEKVMSNASVETFVVNKPLAQVVAFYSSFLKENGFLLIGGEDPSGFNASAKKNNAMFTLKIYSQNQKTIIHFIW